MRTAELLLDIAARLACQLLTVAQTGVSQGVPVRPPYRPFLDPLDVHNWWWVMLLPMAFGIAVVYKAVRLKDLRGYWLAVLSLTFQIVAGMVLLGAATYLLVEVYARWMVEQVPR